MRTKTRTRLDDDARKRIVSAAPRRERPRESDFDWITIPEKSRRGKLTDERVAEAVELLEEGCSVTVTARIIGVTRGTLERWIAAIETADDPELAAASKRLNLALGEHLRAITRTLHDEARPVAGRQLSLAVLARRDPISWRLHEVVREAPADVSPELDPDANPDQFL